jgi:ABC-type uncharacterized transport system ATPase subunit
VRVHGHSFEVHVLGDLHVSRFDAKNLEAALVVGLGHEELAIEATEAAEGVALVRSVQARGVTIIMVEHVMEVVLPLVSRAVVLNLGRVLTIGTPAEIVRNPDVIRAYLGDRYAPA